MLDRTHQKAPAFEIYSGERFPHRRGVGSAPRRKATEIPSSVSFDDPSFSSGYYNLYAKRGAENSYDLTFERPRARKDSGDSAQAA